MDGSGAGRTDTPRTSRRPRDAGRDALDHRSRRDPVIIIVPLPLLLAGMMPQPLLRTTAAGSRRRHHRHHAPGQPPEPHERAPQKLGQPRRLPLLRQARQRLQRPQRRQHRRLLLVLLVGSLYYRCCCCCRRRLGPRQARPGLGRQRAEERCMRGR